MKHRTSWARLASGTCVIGIFAAATWSCGSDTPSSPMGVTGGNGGAGGTGGSTAGSSNTGGAGSSSAGNASGGSSGAATGGGSGSTGGSAGAESGGSAGTSGGSAGAGGSGGSSTGTGGSAGSPPDAGGTGGSAGTAMPEAGSAALAFSPHSAAISGVIGVVDPTSSQTLQLHNGGQAAAQVSKLTLSGTNQAMFVVTSPKQLPATIMPGADLPVTLELTAAAHALTAQSSTEKDSGAILLTAQLSASVDTTSVGLPVYGLVVSKYNWEATLGQILVTQAFPMKVGKAQNDWNWNNKAGNDPKMLPGVEPGTDEVAAQTFVKAGTGEVSMVPLARFSPEGAVDFGWYPPGKPDMRTKISTLASTPDAQTSSKARMVYPPLAGGKTSFDPGTTPFGVWAFSGQAAAGTAYGDYDYSQDNLNLPAPTIHRVKAWTLKDANGPVANSYLLGFEEAANGDYQDYVFILSNVKPAP